MRQRLSLWTPETLDILWYSHSCFIHLVYIKSSDAQVLVHRLTNCHLQLLPTTATAASAELLGMTLFQATAGGGKRSVCTGSAKAGLFGSLHTVILLPCWAADRQI